MKDQIVQKRIEETWSPWSMKTMGAGASTMLTGAILALSPIAAWGAIGVVLGVLGLAALLYGYYYL